MKCKEIYDALNFSLKHEQYVTSLINKIYKAANEVDDYRTMQFFDWFVKEQGEEEKSADDLLKSLSCMEEILRGFMRSIRSCWRELTLHRR